MNIEVGNIDSQNDTNINILLHIKNNVNLDIEIKNIVSGGNIDIEIRRFFQKSPDFKKLDSLLNKQRRRVQNLNKDKEEYNHERSKLNDLENAYTEFRVGTLILADTFLNIDSNSQRLKRAKEYFEQGLISQADKVLIETELIDDQDFLIMKMKYLQERKLHLLNEFNV